MPRSCTICVNKHKLEIDRAILAGETYGAIARRFGVSRHAVANHRRSGHIPAAIIKAQEVEEVAEAGDLLLQMRRLHARTLAILSDAERRGDQQTALKAIKEARGNLELLTKLYVLLVGTPKPDGMTIEIIDRTIPIPDFRELEGGDDE